MKNIQTVILTGGKSSRMGQDKAMLEFGERTFLEHLILELAEENELLLSVGKGRRYSLDSLKEHGFRGDIRYVEDISENCGPLGGLHSIFEELKEGAVFVTTADLPLVDRLMREELKSYLSSGLDGVIPIEEDGRVHPLCGMYRVNESVRGILAGQMEEENYRVRDFLNKLKVCYVPTTKLTNGKKKLRNINTQEDYRAFLEETGKYSLNAHGIPVVSLVGYSGSGKTTFLERMIPELKQRKIRLAVLKHDGKHEFSLDKEGKDSYRFMQAGADEVLLVSEKKGARLYYHPVSARELVDEIRGVDLILTEGLKHGPYVKVMLDREASGKPAAPDVLKEEPLFIVTDRTVYDHAGCPVYGFEDAEKAAQWLYDYVRTGRECV